MITYLSVVLGLLVLVGTAAAQQHLGPQCWAREWLMRAAGGFSPHPVKVRMITGAVSPCDKRLLAGTAGELEPPGSCHSVRQFI